MGLFGRKKDKSGLSFNPVQLPPSQSQVELMIGARIPVFLSKLHAQNPPRWVTVRGDRLESVTGLESPEYMDDASNHEVWSVDHFVSEFPFVQRFLNEARPGQTALFTDTSGDYRLGD